MVDMNEKGSALQPLWTMHPVVPRGLVCLDLDGTLLDSNKQISAGCRAAIVEARSQGLIIAIDSGRHPFNVFDLMDSLGLLHTCVCLSGAIAFLDGVEVARWPIDLRKVNETIDVAERCNSYISIAGADFNLTCGGIDRGPESAAKAKVFNRYEGMNTYDELREAATQRDGQLLKLALHGKNEVQYAAIRAGMAELGGVEVAQSDERWVDVTTAGCTKADGIVALASALELETNRVAVVGDDENDLDAIAAAGLGIAMGNALPQVKQVARVTVADNDHDGAAEALSLAESQFQ